jgi:hypothetical protein
VLQEKQNLDLQSLPSWVAVVIAFQPAVYFFFYNRLMAMIWLYSAVFAVCAKLLHPVEGIMVPSSLLSADYGDAFVSMFSNFLCRKQAWIQ